MVFSRISSGIPLVGKPGSSELEKKRLEVTRGSGPGGAGGQPRLFARLRRGCRSLRRVICSVSAGCFLLSVAGGAEVPPDPLEADPGEGQEARVLKVWQVRNADQALQMGFSSLAVAGYRELLAALPEEDPVTQRLQLSLATALISEAKFEEARTVLNGVENQEDAGYLLRRGFLDWQARRWRRLAAALDQIKPEELAPMDEGWYFFLKGLSADHTGEGKQAEEAFARAVETAASENQRAHFILGQYQARLFAEEASEKMASELKAQMEAFQGKGAGYRFAQQYAVMLDLLGKKEEATEVIRTQIQNLPDAEGEVRDELLLLDGLISGSDSGQGRESLRQLLETGGKRDLQRIALQRLAANVTPDSTEFFAGLLTRLIEAEHPLQEELHLFRAQLGLRQAVAAPAGEARNERFAQAAADAEVILTRFPGSRLKREALEVLAASAWEQRRYRTSANHLMKLRGELPPGQRRAEVGLLVADCYFRAGEVNRAGEDYRNAADAYGAVLREQPASISAGLLLYQRVLSEIHGGRLAQASSHLKEIPDGVTIEPSYRWQAEWNLVKAMQGRGQMMQAYERVAGLLEDEDADVISSEGLRLRFEWLRAQLSYDAGRAEETIPLVEEVLARLEDEALALDERLKERIAAYALLLQGQARLALGETEGALAALEEIRRRFPGTDPALYSYLVEARHYTRVNRTVDAQQLLISLADSHKESRYAPIALYEAALNAQRRGQDADYQNQAIKLLERLVNEYPGNELAFYARLHQGDLLRQLNRFENAESVYQFIENNFPNHPDLPLVQLSLADCYLAQEGGREANRFQNALAILERLFDLPTLSADLRAEAGFKIAYANAARGNEERALEVYWATVSNLYLDEQIAETLGSRGRYWVARSLLEYGQQFERLGRLDNARKAYAMISENGLPGKALAGANLARLMPKGASQ